MMSQASLLAAGVVVFTMCACRPCTGAHSAALRPLPLAPCHSLVCPRPEGALRELGGWSGSNAVPDKSERDDPYRRAAGGGRGEGSWSESTRGPRSKMLRAAGTRLARRVCAPGASGLHTSHAASAGARVLGARPVRCRLTAPARRRAARPHQ